MRKTSGVTRIATFVILAASATLSWPGTTESSIVNLSAPGVQVPTSILASADSSSTLPCAQQSLLPAYFYPGAAWQSALSSATPGSSIIVNPSSGPGTTPNAAYQQVIAAARSEGVRLWGYIDTKYTSTPLGSIDSQIADYQEWYGITNIFFDDASSSAGDLSYYRLVSQAVRTADPGASVMLNPGDYPDSSYASLGDVLVVFEGDYQSFLQSEPPSWVNTLPADMFAALVSAVPAAQMPSVVALSSARNVGYTYVTDHVDVATLYEQLPSYWTAELQDLSANCGSGPTLTAPSQPGSASSSQPGTVDPPGLSDLPPGEPGAPAVPSPASNPGSLGDSLGYRMVTSTGGVLTFGDAAFYGTTASKHLNAPIVAMAPTPDGHGYWLIGADWRKD